MFDHAWLRFATSGTLILCYGIADHLARRRGSSRPMPPSPRWVAPLIVASLTAFYLLIGPTGGPLLAGLGNGAGIVLAGVAMMLRSGGGVRYPEIGARSLFYVALPIATGVPWGLLALSLPALVSSIYCCRRADRLRDAAGGREAPMLPRYRLMPGIW